MDSDIPQIKIFCLECNKKIYLKKFNIDLEGNYKIYCENCLEKGLFKKDSLDNKNENINNTNNEHYLNSLSIDSNISVKKDFIYQLFRCCNLFKYCLKKKNLNRKN